MKTKAQVLYDLRELTGFVSGTDLHKLFKAHAGEPSPSGRVSLNVEHPEMDRLLHDPAAIGEAIGRYCGDEVAAFWAKVSNVKSIEDALRATVRYNDAHD